MTQPFTDYLKALDVAGGPPDDASFQRICEALRGALASEIKQRGLWSSPPSYLGIFGWHHWLDEAATRRTGDALDELVAECYSYVFVTRLRSLRAQLRLKSNIDGLVFRNLRNFLHDVQKRHDPLGFRIYSLLCSALQRALANGRLRILSGGPKIGNATLLGWQPTSSESGQSLDLAAIVERWNDSLLPDLITARGKALAALVDEIENRLRRLPEEGIAAFRFQRLIDPFKADVRRRWAALLLEEQGETAFDGESSALRQAVRIVLPDMSLEARSSLQQLDRCVARRIETARRQRRSRDQLLRLWQFLVTFALTDEEALPSQRKLSQFLAIPRDRFRDLLRALREMITGCRGGSRDNSAEHRPDPQEAQAMHRNVDRGQLRRRTERAWRSATTGERDARRAGDRAQPGDLFVLAETAEHGIEWLVVEVADGRCLLAPADTVPLAGAGDIEIPAESPPGPLTLRCREMLWIDAERLASERRTAAVSRQHLEAARQARRELEAGTLRAPVDVREVELDPELAQWRQQLTRARVDILGSPNPDSESSSAVPRWHGLRSPLGLAAAILLVCTLLLFGRLVSELARQADLEARLEHHEASLRGAVARPLVNLPLAWLRPVGRERGEATAVEVPAAAPSLLLILQLERGEPKTARYRVEATRGRDGEVVWQANDLRDVGVSEITLLLPRSAFPIGTYRLYLMRQGQDDRVAEYELEIRGVDAPE